MNHPAHIDVPDRHGRTALHFAAQAGSPECVDLLFQAGAFSYRVELVDGPLADETGSRT